MKTSQTTEFELTLDEVKMVIHNFLLSQKKISPSDNVLQVSHVTRSEEIPGVDPHDCDYVEKFAGLRIVVKAQD